MADNNTTQISKVLIDTTGDGQGDKTAHFAADIDNFMVYTDTATAHSVKDLVFGDTPPSDFIKNGDMWTQLKTQADRCVTTLTANASFWNGLSNENYQDPSEDGDAGSSYLATGDDINNLNFYGNDYFTSSDNKDKLVSLGALEDFAKRIPTMGAANTVGTNAISIGQQANGLPSKAAVNSIAVGGIAQGENSVAFNGQAKGKTSVALAGGQANATNGVAIGPNTEVNAFNGIGIGSNLRVNDAVVILGRYNAPFESMANTPCFAVGVGTSDTNRKTGLILEATNSYAAGSLRPTLYTDAINVHGEWVSTCAWVQGTVTQNMESLIISQPLKLWTKATVLLTGLDSAGIKVASQMITIMPYNMYSAEGVHWYAHTVNSTSTRSIAVTNVVQTGSSLIFTLSVSGLGGGSLKYSCEFTGMGM